MPVHRFSIPGHATRRDFSIYAVVARRTATAEWYVYVGKTGDNRAGCNPVVSRAGNHFSYNDIHSQVRTKLAPALPHEFDFEYFYVPFHPYSEDDEDRRGKIDSINEMERAANVAIYDALPDGEKNRLLNRYSGRGYISKENLIRRLQLRTDQNNAEIASLVAAVISFVRPRE